jgi:hypothetical protein
VYDFYVKLLKLNSGDFDLSLFLSDEHREYISEEGGILNIIVGWGLAKSMGASIRNHKIDDNTYWTFLPTEKRKIFQEHLKEFKQVALDKLKSGKTTSNINPLTMFNRGTLILYLKKEFDGCVGYLFNDRLYIYGDKCIYHLDMGLLDFMSWDIDDEIRNILNIKKLNDSEYKEYSKYIDSKYIPYLIDAEENTFSRDVC